MSPQIVFLLNKSIELIRNSDFEPAELYLNQALRIDRRNPHALRLLGVIFAQKKNYLGAIKFFKTSLKILPNNSLTYSNLGNVFLEIEKYRDALNAYDNAIKIDPKYEEAWFNKGNALQKLGLHGDALTHYDKALALKPNYAEAYCSKGNALFELKRFNETLTHYDKALALKPNFAEAYFNRGNVLYELKRFDEALTHYDKALALKPNFAEAYFNRGNVLYELKRFDEALTHYDMAINLNNEIDWAHGSLLHTELRVCNWSRKVDLSKRIFDKLLANKMVSQPFFLLALEDDPLLHKKSAELYIQSKYPFNPVLGPPQNRSQNQKIKIGYFSADFHNHATGYLMAELFELHDKRKFELFGFSFGPITGDEMRLRLQKSFDRFIEVGNQSDIEIARLSRILNIDIAVDLKGFTQDSRTRIFSYRAAPIQINYLGYPGTVGSSYMDYIIADKTLIPVEFQSFYSEKVVYLPNSYQVNDRRRLVSDKQFSRLELGLPENSFVFCCFNNNYKIMPETFNCWLRILKSVEGSVLWLLQDNPWAVDNLKKEAQKQGINSERLVFAERVALPDHLSRHRQADLFLDTFPYNAHTTASDALWAGLPVLSLIGRSFASRVAASLLNAIGLPELIANTPEKYEALAIELAQNPEMLCIIKKKLNENRLVAPLFNTPQFTKKIEGAYLNMYERYQANLAPDHFEVV